MEIRCNMEMESYVFMEMFADHYNAERTWAWEYIELHTEMNGHYDDELVRIIYKAMDIKFSDFRFAFEKYMNKERKINNHYIENCVAFGLTLDYFGIEKLELDIENVIW